MARPGSPRKRHRAALASSVLCVLAMLAGCGEEVDLSKATYERSTVPAAGTEVVSSSQSTPPPETPEPGGAEFTPENLRAIDPCALLHDELLSRYGTPDDHRRADFGTCSNYMTDHDGEDLAITIYVGHGSVNPDEADESFGGLPGYISELDSGDACFARAITSSDPDYALRVQIGGATGQNQDLCTIAREVIEDIVGTVRDDPPIENRESGSLADLDPCAMLNDTTVTEVLGGDPEPSPTDLHWCRWHGDDLSSGVWFREGYDPASDSEPGKKVTIDGVDVYQTRESSRCEMEWAHRATDGDDSEVVLVEVDGSGTAKQLCSAARSLSKSLIGNLPG